MEPLGWEHQQLLTALWRRLDVNLSEYSFANAFLFRREHAYRVKEVDGLVFVTGCARDGTSIVLPTVAPSSANKATFQKVMEEATLFPVPDQWLPLFPDDYARSFLPSESDYCYLSQKMRTLAGRHLASRRNLMHQFQRHEEVEVTPFQPQDAAALLVGWERMHPQGGDVENTLEAITYFERLQLEGISLYVKGKLAGFLLGEPGGDRSFIYHFAKGNPAFKGIYPALYVTMALRLPSTIQWINLEQDLGLPGLKQAKMAYEPDRLANKWRISRHTSSP